MLETTKSKSIENFCSNLACKKPTPGGGSVAALQGALGCGLIAMVCDLTIGKEKYNDFQEINKDVLIKANENKDTFLTLIDEDIKAYSQMKDIFSLPQSTEEEKSIRQNKMQKALKECAIPPYNTLMLAAKSVEILTSVIGKSNTMAASDLGCAATNLYSCMKNAWLNVKANTDWIKDIEFKNNYEKKCKDILTKYKPICENIYNNCL